MRKENNFKRRRMGVTRKRRKRKRRRENEDSKRKRNNATIQIEKLLLLYSDFCPLWKIIFVVAISLFIFVFVSAQL